MVAHGVSNDGRRILLSIGIMFVAWSFAETGSGQAGRIVDGARSDSGHDGRWKATLQQLK